MRQWFKTKEEAREELDNNREKYLEESKLFCPLIKMQCVTNCVCWHDPWLHHGIDGDGNKISTVNPGYCSSPLITGEITTNYA